VDPQLSRIQAILNDRVRPRLDEAVARLTTVAADPNYRFLVSGKMRGDVTATPLEIDHSDILALRGAARLLGAACDVATAYNLSFATYDSVGVVNALTQTSGWMSLATGGAARMQAAYTATLAAADDASAAITSILAETDDQDDDVLKKPPDAAGIAELVDWRDNQIPQGKSDFTNGFTMTNDWDGDPATPETDLEIHPATLFTNPVPDWKALLPPYHVRAEQRPLGVYFAFRDGAVALDFDAPSPGDYYAAYTLWVENGTVLTDQFSGTAEFEASMRARGTTVVDSVKALMGFAGTAYFSSYFTGTLPAGPQTVIYTWYAQWSQSTADVFVPVITWNAPDFASWLWPDPTMHGLFPLLGTPADFNTTFGVSAAKWTPEVVLDWTSLTQGFFPPVGPRPARLTPWSARSVSAPLSLRSR